MTQEHDQTLKHRDLYQHEADADGGKESEQDRVAASQLDACEDKRQRNTGDCQYNDREQ